MSKSCLGTMLLIAGISSTFLEIFQSKKIAGKFEKRAEHYRCVSLSMGPREKKTINKMDEGWRKLSKDSKKTDNPKEKIRKQKKTKVH